MSKRYHVVGVDCGASGGKMVSAYFDGERLTENEYIPFPNRSVRVLDSLYHDFFSLYNHSLDGLAGSFPNTAPQILLVLIPMAPPMLILMVMGALFSPRIIPTTTVRCIP
mgnify:CR=1 FL=1